MRGAGDYIGLWLRLLSSSTAGVWLFFIATSLALAALSWKKALFVFGDVRLYSEWARSGLAGEGWVGIDVVWVYPALALVPMAVVGWFVSVLPLGNVVAYQDAFVFVWFSLIVAMNAVAIRVLLAQGRRGRLAATWWIVFLGVLGPAGVTRIDALSVSLAVVAVVLVLRRPIVAGALLCVATWIKVWPAVILGALVVVLHRRRAVAVSAFSVAALVSIVFLAAGAGSRLLGFLLEQANRGLQIESTAAAVLMALPFTDVHTVWSGELKTYQLDGEGVGLVASVLTPLMVVFSSVLLCLGGIAVRRGAAAVEVLSPLVLALVSALVLLNKVGSPQFFSWLAVPLVLNLMTARTVSSWRAPALAALAAALVTHAVFPWGYSLVLNQTVIGVTALVIRGGLLVFLTFVGIRGVWRAGVERGAGSSTRCAHGLMSSSVAAGEEKVSLESR